MNGAPVDGAPGGPMFDQVTVRRTMLGLWAAVLIGGCSADRQTEYVRSPSLDYGREPPRTSDDRVVGADGVDPQDRLAQGATVGTESEPAPGWTVGDGGVRHEPEQRAGGFGATSKEQEEATTPKATPATNR